MRMVLGLEYDGRDFCGWQAQAGGGSVQDALEHGLAQIIGQPVRTVAAGRTDAGVHALQQVVHFDTPVTRPPGAWVRGVNAFLPAALRVLWAQPVTGDFHARFDATGRSYQYLLLNQPVAPAVLAGRAGWHHRPLDIGAMRAAAAHFPGEHDFSAFRAAGCQAKSPVKKLYRAEVYGQDGVILFEFGAGAFLHHQVRNMVGALVAVGQGSHPPEWMKTLLQSASRKLAPPTFSPDGLYFTGVDYDARLGLPVCRRTLQHLLGLG